VQFPLKENASLQSLHTFGLDVKAAYYARISQAEDLERVFALPHEKLILGGGSNLVFLKDYPSLIVHLATKGIRELHRDSDHVWISVQAGENWHEFVLWCLEHNYGGVENLSLIPGTVGASPIQNIGAYGVELESVFDHLIAIDISSGERQKFTMEDCCFGYRDSVFKNNAKGKYCIVEVVFRLTCNRHELVLNYGAIKSKLQDANISEPTIRDVSKAVIEIRNSKLPDPSVLGNAGSFFKNPIISKSLATALQRDFPKMPTYDLGDDEVKIPAAWMIEQTGWKGKRLGGVGVYEKHALVLVNHGSGQAGELAELIGKIQSDVKTLLGIELQTEVNLI